MGFRALGFWGVGFWGFGFLGRWVFEGLGFAEEGKGGIGGLGMTWYICIIMA